MDENTKVLIDLSFSSTQKIQQNTLQLITMVNLRFGKLSSWEVLARLMMMMIIG